MVIEAGTSYGWLGIIDAAPADTLFVTVDQFGASAPYAALIEKYGFTEEQVVEKIKKAFY